MMTVMGIITKPTEARANAPHERFSSGVNFGRLDEEGWFFVADAGDDPRMLRRRSSRSARFWRSVLRVVK